MPCTSINGTITSDAADVVAKVCYTNAADEVVDAEIQKNNVKELGHEAMRCQHQVQKQHA